MTPEEQRLRNKLALWQTAGFSQFIEDLAGVYGSVINIRQQVDSLHKVYAAKLKEEMEPNSKYKQTKLPL